ncbi:archaetidylserine decarboxylase [Paenibacillus bovis]|uniref:phosphatidylserine decarboxylase n=1 Tax=Paenibacillus bovis TaxID=1616788 RepID=A0A172ZKR1_9BACL|nr:archaetidylserine decarboxylase [Paenibacillus bovis]ANF98133.1 phosphatidylserine decarboxylase [Paenibacillus bovis]
MANSLFRLMTELSSRKWVSRLTGSFAKSRASRALIPKFIQAYRIPAEDAEKSVNDYHTLNEFFTRRLRPGARPVDADPMSLTSPVDALITAMGPLQDGLIPQVKGQDYSLEELLNHSPRMETYRDGYMFVLYLSPTDYHRIHAPVTGKQTERDHIPGKVYPVNDKSMLNMRAVLSRNERQITYMQHHYGEVAVVKVGALNVSSIRYADETRTSWNKGDELAYFEFGSTIVLLIQQGTFTPDEMLHIGSRVKMGEKLGTLMDMEATRPYRRLIDPS